MAIASDPSALLLVALIATKSVQPPERTRPSLRVPTIIYTVAASADWVTTYQALGQGAREENPTLSWANKDRRGLFLAAAIAEDVAIIWAWNKYVGKKHPRIAKFGLYGWAIVRVWLAIQNVCRVDRPCGPPSHS